MNTQCKSSYSKGEQFMSFNILQLLIISSILPGENDIAHTTWHFNLEQRSWFERNGTEHEEQQELFQFGSFFQAARLFLQTQYRYPVANCGLFNFDWTFLFAVRIEDSQMLQYTFYNCGYIDFRWQQQQPHTWQLYWILRHHVMCKLFRNKPICDHCVFRTRFSRAHISIIDSRFEL